MSSLFPLACPLMTLQAHPWERPQKLLAPLIDCYLGSKMIDPLFLPFVPGDLDQNVDSHLEKFLLKLHRIHLYCYLDYDIYLTSSF